MPRNKKILIIICSILVIYSLIGFVAVPLILESMLPDKLSAALHRQVSIKNIRLNPFSLSVSVQGLNIQDKNNTDSFVAFDELFVNVQTWSLFKLGLVLKEAKLVKPDIRLVRISETEFNFSDLIPEKKIEEKTEEQKGEEDPFQFSVSNIAVIDGRISLEDKLIEKHHVFSGINLMLPRISNFDTQIETFSEPRLSGDFNQAGLSIDMETKPFHDTLETILHLTLKDINIPYYFAYVPESMVGFDIRNGTLNIDARVSHIYKNNQPEVVVQGKIILSNLEIIEKNQQVVLDLPELQIDVAPSRPLENQIKLTSVTITSPELSVKRDSDGIINLTKLVPQSAESDHVTEAKPEESSSGSISGEKPLKFDLTRFTLDSGKIVFKDFAVAAGSGASDDAQEKISPAEILIDNLDIMVSGLSNAPDQMADYDIHGMINQEAEIKTRGRLGITPLKVESDFSIGGVKLAWGQPYIPDTVQLMIVDGKFSTTGRAAVLTGEDGEIAATITGQAAINTFKSLEPSQKETFLAWQTFSFDGIDVSVNPLKVKADKILLKDFTNQVIILNDGTLNIDKIFITSETETGTEDTSSATDTEEGEATAQVVPVRVNELLLENCDFRFMDRNIKPHFSTRLNLSEVRVTGLTSEDFKAADVRGKGKIDEYAPVTIKGSINPLKEDIFLDITYTLKNMELSPMSPYTGKYIGRIIEKGKLTSDIEYKIDQRTINARNRILLDQFTLGQKVDSEEALNLPVGIAIALLKDREGKINLDIPISGRTDDPEFKIGKTLVKTLTNLIVKAATSPFDLVSSVVGGGEELRFIEFDAASPIITDASVEKLDAVKKLMYERPALTMEVAGYVDVELDRAALKDRMLARKVKMRKLKKGATPDMAVIDDMKLSPEEYEKLLKEVYREDILSDPEKKKSLKPVNDPDLTIQEMESLIRQEIEVTEAELHLLAIERARQVKNYLLQDESISPDRLFLKEPDSLSPEGKGEFRAARAELNVR